MDYKRDKGRIDVNDAITRGLIVFDEEETHGARKNKFWFNDYQWLYKDVDNLYSTYEDYAELISYEIAKLLGMNCAEYDLASYNGKRGVISKSVVGKGKKIVSGTSLLSTVFDEYFTSRVVLNKKFKELLEKYSITSLDDLYTNKSLEVRKRFFEELVAYYNQTRCNANAYNLDVNNEDMMKDLFDFCLDLPEVYNNNFNEMKNGILVSNNLYDIWNAVEIYCYISGYKVDTESFMKNLVDMFIFDIITSQGDRHADNWSVIIDEETGELTLSGIYDNSGALALNRKKAIVNINDLVNRLQVEKNPGKRNGIFRLLSNTINHSFSGIKVSSEDVINRSKNEILLDEFMDSSDDRFLKRLQDCVDILDDDAINTIFRNIEEKTGEPVPEIVKNVSSSVIKHNISKISELLNARRGLKL